VNPKLIPTINAAISAGNARFNERHPPEHLPRWFQANVAQSTRVIDDRTLEMRFYVEKKVPLKKNQFWELASHGPRLIEVDEGTGERRVVITRDTGSFIDLFVANIDLISGSISVMKDTDFDTFDQSLIEPPVHLKFPR